MCDLSGTNCLNGVIWTTEISYSNCGDTAERWCDCQCLQVEPVRHAVMTGFIQVAQREDGAIR
jgi:hypothetical protein